MLPKPILGTAIAAAVIGTAAPASADPGNPFSQLCMVSQCSTSATATVRHGDLAQVQAGIRQGMQFGLSPNRQR